MTTSAAQVEEIVSAANDGRIQRYALGFQFRANDASVWLVKKDRPAWQRGLWNGRGGKVEVGETPRQAMIRESLEESGTGMTDWRAFCVLTGVDFEVACFDSRSLLEPRSCESEIGEWVDVASIAPEQLVKHVGWLLNLARQQTAPVIRRL